MSPKIQKMLTPVQLRALLGCPASGRALGVLLDVVRVGVLVDDEIVHLVDDDGGAAY